MGGNKPRKGNEQRRVGIGKGKQGKISISDNSEVFSTNRCFQIYNDVCMYVSLFVFLGFTNR